VRRADSLSPEALLELFNLAFSDYVIPMRLDLAALTTRNADLDVDVAASPLADVDGEPAAFALLALRGDEGWIGGMGVVPDARRRGLGRAVMEAAADEARSRGARDLWLEVIDRNEPAVQLYGQLGYEHVRDVDVWSLADGGPAVPGATPVAVDDAHAWIAAHRAGREPWQRADGTLAHLLQHETPPVALELTRDGERVGAVVHDGPWVVQLAAGDADVRLLLEAVRGTSGSVRWLNAPTGGTGARAMAELGATLVARQHELVLRL
jgi:ribosomal protein S18 acetylase RimI-like enzyme